MAALDFLKTINDELRARHQFSLPRELQSEPGAVCVFDGRRVVNLSSNNYLGFATHPKLKEAAIEAVRKFGVGTGAVRTIAGTLSMHRRLEEKMAAFKGAEAALLYPSGFAANAGTVAALLDKDSVVISDELNHASIIDGCRLSGAEKKVLPHADMAALARLIDETPASRRTLVITDGVFSMDGDIGRLDQLTALCKPKNFISMVDDAHATGVIGRGGRGTADHWGLPHGAVDITVGTLSKAIGVVGGYVCGSRDLIDYLLQRARPQLFTTTLPPAVVAACEAAFDLLAQDSEPIERLKANASYWRNGLKELGFNDGGRSETPIIPVMTFDEEKAQHLSARLFEEGVFAKAIHFPTVPKGKARVRTIVSAGHTTADLDMALRAFEKVGRELGLI